MSSLRSFAAAASAVALATVLVVRADTPHNAPLPPTPAAGGSSAEILWDTYGVPHVFAADLEGLFYGFGWAQMQAHGDLVLTLYGQARGRAAEYWGPEQLESDRWVRLMGIPARAQAWYEAQTPEFRRALDAFVAGANAYARAHGDRLDPAATVALPVTGPDVLGHIQRVLHFQFVVGQDNVEALARPWRDAGSNAWAVSPQRSASGHALLVANPHLPWSDVFTWFEAQLVAPGIDATGAALVGQPLLGIAFNESLGWTHTVNTHDGADLYELTLADGGYVFDGAVRRFDESRELIKVRQPDGSVRDDTLHVKRSAHGPVVSEKAGKALALRVVGLDQPNLGQQYLDMLRATSLDAFEAVERRLQMPMFTTMYADRAGNILHLFGGRTPMRPSGDYRWTGIVPGSVSSTLWRETHPYDQLPRVVNPPSGWLQNANDPPWTTTFPMALDPAKYPDYMAPRAMSFRAQRSARMLDEDASVTFDELVAYKHSTRMELADRLLDDLLQAAEKSSSETARRAAATLAAWDRSADASSRGAVLFEAFVDALFRQSRPKSPFAAPWSETGPRTTPDGLADPATAALALDAAVTDLEKRGLAPDVPWGDVYRLRRDGLDLPGNGGPGSLGIFRVTGFDKAANGRSEATRGDSWVAAIEFSSPVRAQVLLGYGNWSQKGSPHRTDQLALYASKQLRTAWRTRADVERHLERRETLQYSPR